MRRAATQPTVEPTLIASQDQSLTSPLSIDFVERDGTLVLTVNGELDVATAPLLDEALTRARGTDANRIVVDLQAVSFMDSSGLHVLIRYTSGPESCPRIRLTKGSPQVQRLFQLSGVLEHLPFDL